MYDSINTVKTQNNNTWLNFEKKNISYKYNKLFGPINSNIK